jgi:glucose-6-phosphate 1-dehydrogenase
LAFCTAIDERIFADGFPVSSQFRNNFLPQDVKIVGYARTKMDHAEFLRRVKSNIKTPTKDMEEQLEKFVAFCSYISGQYDQDESFEVLKTHLEEVEEGRKETNRIFYMALPPSVFIPVSRHLKKICYPKTGIARVIVRFLFSPKRVS